MTACQSAGGMSPPADQPPHPRVTAGVTDVTTTLISADYTRTPDFAALVRRSAVVAEFEVVAVRRGEVYRAFDGERDQLALATLRPTEVLVGEAPGRNVTVAVGTWLPNPQSPEDAEVLRTTGWTFAVGDRVIGGLKPTRFDGIYGWSGQDAYFVLEGDHLSAELARTRVRISSPDGVRALATNLDAAGLRRALRQAARQAPAADPD